MILDSLGGNMAISFPTQMSSSPPFTSPPHLGASKAPAKSSSPTATQRSSPTFVATDTDTRSIFTYMKREYSKHVDVP
jgi:hypothetical protein